jgi:hypothetical protein
MIVNPEWLKPKAPFPSSISLDCIEKLVKCMEGIDIEEMDCDTCLKMQEILSDEFDDEEFLEFAIDNFCELFGYIASGRVNIRIHRDIEGKMWFGVG